MVRFARAMQPETQPEADPYTAQPYVTPTGAAGICATGTASGFQGNASVQALETRSEEAKAGAATGSRCRCIPTSEAILLLEEKPAANAILHLTC
jgi:hypothetical protein